LVVAEGFQRRRTLCARAGVIGVARESLRLRKRREADLAELEVREAPVVRRLGVSRRQLACLAEEPQRGARLAVLDEERSRGRRRHALEERFRLARLLRLQQLARFFEDGWHAPCQAARVSYVADHEARQV